MEFPRQEYWSGLPFPSPGDLPNPGIEPRSPALQADALPSEPPGKLIRRSWIQKKKNVHSGKILKLGPDAPRAQNCCWLRLCQSWGPESPQPFPHKGEEHTSLRLCGTGGRYGSRKEGKWKGPKVWEQRMKEEEQVSKEAEGSWQEEEGCWQRTGWLSSPPHDDGLGKKSDKVLWNTQLEIKHTWVWICFIPVEWFSEFMFFIYKMGK